MDHRDKARSDFFLAQLKSQPNTPGPNASGEVPYSARDGGWNPMYSARWVGSKDEDIKKDEMSTVEERQGENVRYLSMEPTAPRPFTLQAPPFKNTPKVPQVSAFSSSPTSSSITSSLPSLQHSQKPLPVEPAMEQQTYAAVPVPSAYPERSLSPIAPGEQIYGTVPIPESYSGARPTSTMPEPQYGDVPIPQQYGAVPIPTPYNR